MHFWRVQQHGWIMGRIHSHTIRKEWNMGNPTYADCGSMLPYMHVQKDTMYLDSTANSSDTLRITSNQDWIINTTQLPSWVSCSLSTGSGNAVVVFTSTIANTSVQRIASVRLSLSDGSNSILITVIQKEHVLSVENKSTPALILRPNPVRSDAEVYITGIPRGEKLSMVLTDLTGRIVFSDTFCHQPYIFHAEISSVEYTSSESWMRVMILLTLSEWSFGKSESWMVSLTGLSTLSPIKRNI